VISFRFVDIPLIINPLVFRSRDVSFAENLDYRICYRIERWIAASLPAIKPRGIIQGET